MLRIIQQITNPVIETPGRVTINDEINLDTGVTSNPVSIIHPPQGSVLVLTTDTFYLDYIIEGEAAWRWRV